MNQDTMGNQYLHQREVEFYEENGYLILDPHFPAQLLTRVREDIFDLLGKIKARLSQDDKRIRETDADLHHKSQAVKELITSEVFRELGRELLGEDVDLRHTITITKTAEHGGPIQWHQDWGLGKDPGYPLFTFWIAITESNLENGCIRIIPGSHKMEIQAHAVSETYPSDRGIKNVDAEKAIPLEMSAGQVLIIHPQVIHGSDSCTSLNPRVAVLGSFQIPKKEYDAFWAKAGAKFLRKGKYAWGPLEVGPANPMDDKNPGIKELMAFVPAGSDYQKEIRFYEAIGFITVWKSEELAILKIGNFRFFLQNFENKEMQSNFMMNLEVENLDHWWNKINGLNLPEKFPGARAKAPEDYPWGKREIHLITPAGVLWHIAVPIRADS
jgi:ectoine hydroxylase-related dioxygenase (phytanoyl-CoA dioxygenase family)